MSRHISGPQVITGARYEHSSSIRVDNSRFARNMTEVTEEEEEEEEGD